MRTTRVWSISLPPNLVERAEEVAREENRTRSELIREALRFYLEERRWRELQREASSRARALGIESEGDVEEMIDELRGRT